MRSQWVVLLLVVCGLLGPFGQRTAQALSCAPVHGVIARAEIIVRGTVIGTDGNDAFDLAVQRYYKGPNDAATVRVELPGLLSPGIDNRRLPEVGDGVIVGLTRDGDMLVNRLCGLFYLLRPSQPLPDYLQSLLGPGQAPKEITQADGRSGRMLLWSGSRLWPRVPGI